MTTLESVSTLDPQAQAQKLRRHFKFTEDDLEANRRGELSPKQRQRIDGYERGGQKIGFVIGGLLAGLGAALMPGEIGSIANLQDPLLKEIPSVWWTSFIFNVIIAVILLAMFGGGMFLIISQLIPHKPYQVLCIRGRARFERGTTGKGESVYYDLYIDDHEFDGDGSLPNIIERGAQYTVYYLKGSEEIVSVERMA